MDKWDTFVADYRGEVSWLLFEAWLVKAEAELGTVLAYPPPKGGLGSHGINIIAGTRRQDVENKAALKEGTARPRGWWQAGPGSYKEAAEEEEVRAIERVKPFPLCKEEGRPGQVHSYERSFPGWDNPGTMTWPSFMLTTCPSFTCLDPAGRAAAMFRMKACVRCGAYLHQQASCNRVAPRCRAQGPDSATCGEKHLMELHKCGTAAVQALGASLASASPASQATTPPLCTFTGGSNLLALSLVPTATGDSHVLLLSDEGSQVNLVRHDTAHRIGAGPGREDPGHRGGRSR